MSDDPLAFPITARAADLGMTLVAERLGIDRKGGINVAESGLADKLLGLPDTESSAYLDHKGAIRMTDAGVRVLAAVPWVGERHPGAVNVRVRAARRVDDADREYMGWHRCLSDDEANLAASRWWPVPKTDVTGEHFIVTVTGFVVKCGRITATTVDRGLAAFTVAWDDREVDGVWAGRRVATPRGGVLVRLPEVR